MPKTNDDADEESVTLQKLEYKIDLVLQNQNEMKAMMQDHEKRIRDLEKTSVELSARLTMWQILQTSFTAITGAIATFLGRGTS